MSDETTKANISIGDCVLEFKGSEVFVQRQIDEFKGLILGELKKAKSGKPKGKPPAGETDQVDEKTEDSPFAKYPNVIDFDGDTINILNVQGTKKAGQTRNLVLMYVWANELIGKDLVPKEELIRLCRDHECYDEANFKTILKNTKGLTLKGSKQKYSVRLTVPGRKIAKELIESLNEES